MRTTFRAMLAIALLALPAHLGAQPGGHAPGMREGMRQRAAERGPFEALLRVRGELGLTDEQVARLTAIGREVEERNRPLRQRLMQAQRRHRGETRERMARLTPAQRRDTLRAIRSGGRPLPPEMRRLMAEMRANVREGMRGAQGVLTPAQKARARELMRERAPRRGHRPMVGRGRNGPPPGRP